MVTAALAASLAGHGARPGRPTNGTRRRAFACPEADSEGCLERTPIFAPRYRLIATSDFTLTGGGRLAIRTPGGSLVRNIEVRARRGRVAWTRKRMVEAV